MLVAIRYLTMSRADLAIENLALRQQLVMYQRQRPKPKPTDVDRAFWVVLKDQFERWADVLVVVKPATVIRWHRQGFRYFWRWKSRLQKPGCPGLSLEIRGLIRTMARDNDWCAPRIQKELGRLGIQVCVDTVRRYVPKTAPSPTQRQSWRTFLETHREVLCGIDFLVVPTVTFRLLYGFFVIHHGRRMVVHFNATHNPTSAWVCQQLREAFPFESAPRYLILDNDSIFNTTVVDMLKAIGIQPVRTAYRSPWQNPVAERWIGSLRRELLDRVIVLGADHLRRLGREYIAYYNADRCHTTLRSDSPTGRPVQSRPSRNAEIIARPRVRGLHHRYEWRDAA